MVGIYGINISRSSLEVGTQTMTGEYAWSTFCFEDETRVRDDYRIHKETNLEFTDIWDLLIASLPKDATRYIIANVEYFSPQDKITRTKRIFVLWAPPQASSKDKLLAAMHLKDVKQQLVKNSYVIMIQANAIEDLKYETILKCIKHKTTVF